MMSSAGERDLIGRLRAERRQALLAARAAGHPIETVAWRFNVTWTRVHIIRPNSDPERTLCGVEVPMHTAEQRRATAADIHPVDCKQCATLEALAKDFG